MWAEVACLWKEHPRKPGFRLCKTERRPGQGRSAPEGVRDRGAKRIRSLYLPWMTGATPELSTATPPKGLASLSTINGATMRLCRGDLPATAHSSRLACPGLAAGKSLPQRSSL
jgi:hypothetical protein